MPDSNHDNTPLGTHADKEGTTSLGTLKNYIAFQLRRAQDVSFQAFAKRAGEANLSPGHFAILSIINEVPGLNQTALSHATGRDKSTLTPALKSLEKQGFISRERSGSDRRAYNLYLTAPGQSYLGKLLVHAEAHDRALDDIVGEFNKPLLIHLLEQIVDQLGDDNGNAANGDQGAAAAPRANGASKSSMVK